jgi:hypothetical protein
MYTQVPAPPDWVLYNNMGSFMIRPTGQSSFIEMTTGSVLNLTGNLAIGSSTLPNYISLNGTQITSWPSALPYISCDETTVSTTISSDLTVEEGKNLTVANISLPAGTGSFSLVATSAPDDNIEELTITNQSQRDLVNFYVSPGSGIGSVAFQKSVSAPSISLNDQSIGSWSDILPYVTCDESTVSTTISSDINLSGDLIIMDEDSDTTYTISYRSGRNFLITDSDTGLGLLHITSNTSTGIPETSIEGDLSVSGDINGYYSQAQVDQMMTDLRAEIAATYALK